MALNSRYGADVPLCNYSLTHEGLCCQSSRLSVIQVWFYERHLKVLMTLNSKL